MFSLSNSLSFLRAPLAFLFLCESATVRVAAILLAMLTDSIDGYLARRRRSVTQFGAVLDPAMDKFFVFFALGIFLFEGKIWLWQALAMISRDFVLCAFGVYLRLFGHWKRYEFKAIRWGKISTALQFLVLIALSVGYPLLSALFYLFIVLGVFSLVELFWELHRLKIRDPR